VPAELCDLACGDAVTSFSGKSADTPVARFVQSYVSAVVILVETEGALLLCRIRLVRFERQLVRQVALVCLVRVGDDILVLLDSIIHRTLKIHVIHAYLLVRATRRT
jgi:hypothetical protein